jgi:hypothetical protein
MLRTNRFQRRRMRSALAWEVKVAIGTQRPKIPFPHARIVIERHAPRGLDPDNLMGACKHLWMCCNRH